jgi:hypothetical protein
MVELMPFFSTLSIHGINFLKFKNFLLIWLTEKDRILKFICLIVCILKIIIIYFKINTFWMFFNLRDLSDLFELVPFASFQ